MTATASPAVPKGVARSVAISTVAQFGARFIHFGVNVGIGLLLVRSFVPAVYGDYVFVMTVTSVLALVSEFGLNGYAVREVSQNPASAQTVISTAVGARLLTAAGAAALAQLICLLFRVPTTLHLAVAISSLVFITNGLLSITLLFHVAVRQEYDAVVRAAIELIEAVIVVALVARSASLVLIVAAPVISAAIGVAIAVVLARRCFGLRLRLEWHGLAPMLRRAVPFALIGIVGVVYLKLDALLLAAMRSSSDVGIYGAAFQPIENLLLTSIVVVNVLFPVAAQSFTANRERFERVYRTGTEVLLGLVLPVPILLLFIADPLVDLVYEPRYAAAVAPLRILAFALVLMVVNVWQGFVLVAAGGQRLTLAYVSAAIALNVAVDVPAIAWLGPVGAAYGTLVTAAFLVTCSTLSVARAAGARLRAGRLLRMAAPGAVLAAIVAFLRGPVRAPWWQCAGAGLCCWPALLNLAGVFSVDRVVASLRPGHRATASGSATCGSVTAGSVTPGSVTPGSVAPGDSC